MDEAEKRRQGLEALRRVALSLDALCARVNDLGCFCCLAFTPHRQCFQALADRLAKAIARRHTTGFQFTIVYNRMLAIFRQLRDVYRVHGLGLDPLVRNLREQLR